jgi:hypothetical protein
MPPASPPAPRPAARSRIAAEVDFDKDGVQRGFLRLFHSSHESAYGFLPIPIMVIRNGPGPTALLVSGTHGDEYEGQVALCNLAKSLTPNRIQGRVILLPAANYPAAMAGRRVSPIDDLNLNRVFPGDAEGSVTRQIAHYIEHVLIPMADLVADLHSGGSSLMYVPSVLTKRIADEARFARQMAALRAFGSPHAYIAHSPPGQGADQTLSGGADRMGVPAIGSELGGGGTVTPAALAIAERGVNNLLVHLGILPERDRMPAPGPTRILEVRGPDYFVYASEDGLFEPLVRLGDEVCAGQAAARIHRPETPWAPAVELAFQRDGFVLCQRIPGRTKRGDCLFHLGTDAPV